ncbi:MAG: hypothetical protein GY842_20235, partial [bacterium]|nr:hypothetical protein [bacterium]
MLAAWFQARTGGAPPDVGRGNILMVQRFFEWRAGESLNAFAARFRGRVGALDRTGELAAFLLSLLAVNRLYAGLPEDARDVLKAPHRDSLNVLSRDHHLEINAEGGRPGLWLGHPHLADALFNGWLPREDVHERAEALLQGIKSCRSAGRTPGEQTAVLWALWRARSDKTDDLVAERVDWPSTTQVLVDAYREDFASGSDLELAYLPVWIHLAVDVVDSGLDPDPVALALDKLGQNVVDETGARLTCHILLHHLDDLEEARRTRVLHRIRGLLDSAPDWWEWPRVAADLVSRTKIAEDGHRLLVWVAKHSGNRMVPTLLRVARAVPGAAEDATEVAIGMARHAGPDAPWAQLFEELVGRDGAQAPSPIVEWAQRHRTEPTVPFVLRALLIREHPGSEPTTRDWLAEHAEAPVANLLIEPLLERYPKDPSLLAVAFEWVRPEYIGADHLLEHLIEHGDRERATALALAWMATNVNAKGWTYVLRRLLDIVLDDTQRQALVEIALAWLPGREDRPEWTHIIRKLLDIVLDDTQRQALVEIALAWLPG